MCITACVARPPIADASHCAAMPRRRDRPDRGGCDGGRACASCGTRATAHHRASRDRPHGVRPGRDGAHAGSSRAARPAGSARSAGRTASSGRCSASGARRRLAYCVANGLPASSRRRRTRRRCAAGSARRCCRCSTSSTHARARACSRSQTSARGCRAVSSARSSSLLETTTGSAERDLGAGSAPYASTTSCGSRAR